jgi:6-phosphogluconolactonase
MNYDLKKYIHPFDERRKVALPGDYEETLTFCVEYFLQIAAEAIKQKDFFTVALSGGSTPKAILHLLTTPKYVHRVDWNKIYFYFGDERAVPPDHPESNYKMAMDTALKELKIPQKHIFRMKAENDGEKNAADYALKISENVPEGEFDLITLGMGDDGHTASLFPHTHALTTEDHWVVFNSIPQKSTNRMTFTYPLINKAHHICFFVLGSAKASIVPKVLAGKDQPLEYPSQKIGTKTNKALWIFDKEAATQLKLPC